MEIFITKSLLKKKCLLWGFILLCSVFTSENAFSIKLWGRKDCCEINYRAANKRSKENVEFYFKFFDFDFTTAHQHGFMKHLDARYSTDDGNTFHHLFSASTNDDQVTGSAWLYLTNKMLGAVLDYSAYPNGVNLGNWTDKPGYTLPKVKILTRNHSKYPNQTWICINWLLDSAHKNVTNVQLKGEWYVAGLDYTQVFTSSFKIRIPKRTSMKSSTAPSKSSLITNETSVAKNSELEITKEADEIVLKVGEQGENIQVYTTSGVLMNTSVASDNVTKIKLPKNQIHTVKVGQARYKVAL